ncbi:MAG TPA: gluconate 2-dehydrogenase subunit 3 family protein [Burkholderiaceae bacterium]
MEPPALTRRGLLRAGSLALLPAALARGSERGSVAAAPNLPAVRGSYAFFDADEAAFVEAALARLIPADELGPGALEAGVALFIDGQLAGRFGQALDWYMQGPFAHGTKQQGWQLALTPAGLYRAAIRAVDAHCRGAHGGRAFAALGAAEQDALLHALERDELTFPDAPGKTFFHLLWRNTQEGYFADPLYGGNRGFAGWKLIGFPGPRYNYVGDIARYGVPYRRATVGLMGRDPTRLPAGAT